MTHVTKNQHSRLVPKILTMSEIESCRRIGRDEGSRSSTIGLVELDALCDTAEVGARHVAEVERLRSPDAEGRLCERTRNPCGTDTWPGGFMCACDACVQYVVIFRNKKAL